jgi:hypothetical protein
MYPLGTSVICISLSSSTKLSGTEHGEVQSRYGAKENIRRKEPTKGIYETDKMILESDGTRSW